MSYVKSILGTDNIKSRESIAIIMMVLGLLTASFDTFLMLNLAGFNFRITFLFQGVLVLYALANILSYGRFVMPLAFAYLLAWAFFMLLFTPNSGLISRGILYNFWLVTFCINMFAAVNVFKTKADLDIIFKAYIYVFAVIALIGIVQFAIGVLGLRPPMVNYFWVGNIPRAHAFTYEPSYFASYLLMGWVMTGYLMIKQSSLFEEKRIKQLFGIITLAIVISGSRPVIAVIFLIASLYMLRGLSGILNGVITKKQIYLLSGFFLLLASAVVLFFAFILPNAHIFLEGTGIGGTAAHSYEARTGKVYDTFVLFLESPIIGRSLGGIAPAIAELSGISVSSNEDTKGFEGTSIFVEVLAASGVIAIIPFVIYVYKIIFNPLKLAKYLSYKEDKLIIIALTLGLIAELIILQYNQNILRAYLWIHISMLCVAYRVLLTNESKRIS